MMLSPIEKLILEIAYHKGLLINDNYDLFAGLTSHTRKQISVWNAHRNQRQRKLGAQPEEIELTADRKTKILQRAWDAGYLKNPQYYDEIAKLTGKTRKQVCVWCAHRREKIKKEKQKTTKKRKAETTSNAYYQSKRRKTEHYQGIDPDAISILRTALIGRVLDSQENVALVSCLINTDIDIVNRWVNDHIHASAALVRG